MHNTVINMCEKFHYDRLRNDRALGNGTCHNNENNKNNKNKNKNNNNNNNKNVGSAWRSVSGSNNELLVT